MIVRGNSSVSGARRSTSRYVQCYGSRTHPVGMIDGPADHHLGNRTGFSVAVDWNVESLARDQGVDVDPIVQDGNPVEDPTLGTERTVARPHCESPASALQAIDLHVVAVRDVGCAVRSDRNVVAEC